MLVVTPRKHSGGGITTTANRVSVPSRILSEKINGLIGRKGGLRMTLDELPVGACWVCTNGSKDLGVFVSPYDVLYLDSVLRHNFTAKSRIEDVSIYFLPVELV